MVLTELTTVPDAALPVQGLKDQLRLGTGFGTDTLQDGLLLGMLRAAMAAIEGRIGKALMARQFLLRLEDWNTLDEQPLPVAPVSAIASVKTVDKAGTQTVLDSATWRLVPDTHRPKLAAVGLLFPNVPADGHIEITFDAGLASTWASLPNDLAQAVMILAATYYEERHDQGQAQVSGLPHAVVALIERWRTVRLLGGGIG